MLDCPSPFLQMSFETTLTFLTKAAIEGSFDNLQVITVHRFIEEVAL
jgi:hypothetical protein